MLVDKIRALVRAVLNLLPDELEEPARRAAAVVASIIVAAAGVTDALLLVADLLPQRERGLVLIVVNGIGLAVVIANAVVAELTRGRYGAYAPATVQRAGFEAELDPHDHPDV